MIPRRYIQQWRNNVPWTMDSQVEQDLIISRALIEMFNNPTLRDHVAFRGGTAFLKTYELEEMAGTKMRALYQRKKGRDLFDLYIILKTIDCISQGKNICLISQISCLIRILWEI